MARLKDVKITPPKVEAKVIEGKRGALKETIAPVGTLPQDWQTAAPRSLFTPRGMPVGHTPDLDRIVGLERREPLDMESPRARALTHMMTERYSNGVPRDGGCDCRTIDPQRFKDNGPGCITELLPIQAYCLYEIGIAKGLLASVPVGGGKTLLGILGIYALEAKKALLLIPASLMEQIWDDYNLLRQHFKVPSIQLWPNGRSKVIPGQPTLNVISYQQLSREKNSDWIRNLGPDAIIADECFPGDTLVLTDEGQLPIAEIVEQGRGAKVVSYNQNNQQWEWRPIINRIAKPLTKTLVEVTHQNGSFVCTEDHKIWTQRGYVKARNLNPSDTCSLYPGGLPILSAPVSVQGVQEKTDLLQQAMRGQGEIKDEILSWVQGQVSGSHQRFDHAKEVLFGRVSRNTQSQTTHPQPVVDETMSEVPSIVPNEGQWKEDFKVLFPIVWSESHAQRKKVPNEGREATEESVRLQCQSGSQTQGTGQTQRTYLPLAWRQRTDNRSTGHRSHLYRASNGVSDSDSSGSWAVSKSAGLLQGGLGGSYSDVGYRDRREHPLNQEMEVPGQAQNSCTRSSRVVSVKVLEQGDLSRPIEGVVYDLTVEKNHNYLANGVLVSNCDKLSDLTSATSKRVVSYFGEHDDTMFCGWTGSLTDKSITEYWHLAAMALKENSPMPLDPECAEDWGRALDAVPNPSPPGALLKLCTYKGQHVRNAFQQRLDWTRGIILADAEDIKVQGKDQILELVIRERPIEVIPPIILEALKKVRNGQRPDTLAPDGKSVDDEELLDAMSIAKCAHEVASGMFYRWVFPRGEPKWLILEWFAKRKAYHCEVRERLLRSEVYLDSPYLCEQAAMRFHGDIEPRADRPSWGSLHWPNWRDIRDKVQPKQEAVRLHSFLVEDAADWAMNHRGIVWYTMVEFAQWLHELTGLTIHSGGTGAGKRLKMEKGDRSIICSINSHGRGRNGLQFLYNEQLLAQVLASSKMTEQLFGRVHRRGQANDQVITDVYMHTSELRKSLDQAQRRAEYVKGTTKLTHKILKATWETGAPGWDD